MSLVARRFLFFFVLTVVVIGCMFYKFYRIEKTGVLGEKDYINHRQRLYSLSVEPEKEKNADGFWFVFMGTYNSSESTRIKVRFLAEDAPDSGKLKIFDVPFHNIRFKVCDIDPYMAHMWRDEYILCVPEYSIINSINIKI